MESGTTLILGITGQVGSYLAESAVAKGANVHGIVRRSSQFNRDRIEPLRSSNPDQLVLHYADLSDFTTLRRIFQEVEPDAVYHLAGQSHVGLSFEIPESTLHEVTVATLSLLEICRDLERSPRIYVAGSSEVFGIPDEVPQTEETAHRPTSPYGCAKSCALQLCSVYRKAFGLFVSTGIAYNHESIRRGPNFVTRKITNSAAKIAMGMLKEMELGNLDAERDWGYAPEFVEAIMSIMAHDEPDDYILATGTRTSVREFARGAFKAVGIEIEFEGHGIDEVAKNTSSGDIVIRVNPKYFRPTDPTRLVGDASKAKRVLGWEPKVSGVGVAEVMAKEELLLLQG